MRRVLMATVLMLCACKTADLTPAHVETVLSVGEEMKWPRAGGDVLLASFVRVIAQPEKYHGEQVQLIGYLNLEFEGNALYLSRELFAHGSNADAIWIDVEGMKLQPPFVRGWVIIAGTFNAERRGHFGMFAGTLENITRLQAWEH